MPIDLALLLLGGFGLSLAASAAMRRYALSRAMMDMPNERSSHTVPTPRGGGVAFVLSFMLGMVGLCLLGYVDARLAMALAVGGGIVAMVGFRDDRQSLSIRIKLIGQIIAASFALAALGGWPTLLLGAWALHLGVWGAVAGLLALVWAINLYNFMDGIDGLAISEAVFLFLGSAVLISLAGGAPSVAMLLASVCAGFAFLNWPPAKLFMGDAGSGFLGFVFAVIALNSSASFQTTVWPWLILPAVFVIDASYTLLRRILSGQRWHEAHCSHAYQRAAKRFGSHRAVTVFIQCVNLCWLLPLACAAQYWPTQGPVLTVLAWLPLLVLVRHFRAGASVIGDATTEVEKRPPASLRVARFGHQTPD